MLFMDIWTWEPEKRDEMGERWAAWKCPDGMTVRGAWLDLSGTRYFVLYEVEDPNVLLAANNSWTDVAKVESIPVMDAENVPRIPRVRLDML